MAVVEMIMQLYTREVVTADRVLAAVQRFSHGREPSPHTPENPEQSVLLWVSHACDALRKKIEQETEGIGSVTNGGEVRNHCDYKNFSIEDGVSVEICYQRGCF